MKLGAEGKWFVVFFLLLTLNVAFVLFKGKTDSFLTSVLFLWFGVGVARGFKISDD